MPSRGDPSHPSARARSAASQVARATLAEPITRVTGAPRLPLPTALSSTRPHLGVMPQVPSGNAISTAGPSASSPPVHRRTALKKGRLLSSTQISPLPSDVCMRAPSLTTMSEPLVGAHGRCDASSQGPLSVRPALSTTNSTEVPPASSRTRLGWSVDEASGNAHSHWTSAAAASCVAAHAMPGMFYTLPRPTTTLSSSLVGFGVVPASNSSNPSASASVLKDRQSSGSGTCGMPSESSSLRPLRVSSLDRDEGVAEECGSEASGAAMSSVAVEVLHRRDSTSTRGSQCSRLPSRRSSITVASGGLGGVADAVASSAAAPNHANVESGGAEMHGAGCPFGWRTFSSLASQRAALAPPLGIFQSGLFLSMDEGDASRAPAMDAPMTPQSFSTMVLARESGEGASHTVDAVRVASSAAATTTTTHGVYCSPPLLAEDGDAPPQQSTHQLTVVSEGGGSDWGRAEVGASGIEEWLVDSGSRGSRGSGTTAATIASGVGLRPGPVAGSGSPGRLPGGRCATPLSSLQLFGSSSQPEMAVSGVGTDAIPSTPTDLSALPHPPPLSTRRRRQGCLDREGRGTNSRVDLGTGVIETDTLERARAVSKDGTRMYEVVNEKYVLYGYELGRGSYSTVRLCYNLWDGHFYAVKVLDRVRLKRRQLGSEASLCKIEREIAMMKQVQHKNIIALHEVIRDPSMRYVYLVLELAESREVLSMRDNGDVLPRRDKGAATAYPETTAREIVKGLLHALMYAHYLGVAHRDIKPSNVLRTADGTVKLCDFGVSILVGEEPMQLRREGSVAFLAPELLLSSEVEVSRFATPAVSSLGATRNRSAAHTLASADSNAHITVTSATTATSGAQMMNSGGMASLTAEATKLSQLLAPPLAGAAVQSGAPAASLREPRSERASFSGGAPSATPPRPSSASLLQCSPDKGDGGGCGAVDPSALCTPSLPQRKPAIPACNAAVVTDAAAAGTQKNASLASTPVAHQLSFPSLVVGHEPVDLFKADVFALGVTVYTMLIGQLPWRASNAASQRAAILAEPDPFLRLYKAAYGDAYRRSAQAPHARMPSCNVLDGDTLPASPPSATLASGHGKANTEIGRGQRAIAVAKQYKVASAQAASSPYKCGRDENQSEQQKCRRSSTRRAAATHSCINVCTQSDRHPAQSLPEDSTASATWPRPASRPLAAKAAPAKSHASSDLATPQSGDTDSTTIVAAPLPYIPPPPHQLLRPAQRKPTGCALLGSVQVPSATAAGTATAPQTHVAVTPRRVSGGERSGSDVGHMKASRGRMWSHTPALTVLLSRAAARLPFGSVVQTPHALSISPSQYVLWGGWAAAMSCLVADPLPPHQRRLTTTTTQSSHRRGMLGIDTDDTIKTDEPEMSDDMKDGTAKVGQPIRPYPSGGLQRVDLSTEVSMTCPRTDSVAAGDVTGTSHCDETSVRESDSDRSATVSCSAATSAASSQSSDDEEDMVSCESIYERLFELEQPCRAYALTERTPLPAAPDSFGEISGTAVDFVRACLCLDPTERRTVFELFRHPWIQDEPTAAAVELSNSLEPRTGAD
ncbi:hypothetical protein LSCM1_06249 [Leishmania martiniquensis]|uniref:Protein kinase domain-containing protein n=1 Tax=Leishmania martiniquensis TaxID=1580590 RepID=A0A836KRZ4_9TRYP|nr:hypothetical protein LSCM1_06249 [Leishmania martiniquensis]